MKGFTQSHIWCLYNYTEKLARIGITSHAQKNLGDIQKIKLPSIGDKFDKNETMGQLESENAIF